MQIIVLQPCIQQLFSPHIYFLIFHIYFYFLLVLFSSDQIFYLLSLGILFFFPFDISVSLYLHIFCGCSLLSFSSMLELFWSVYAPPSTGLVKKTLFCLSTFFHRSGYKNRKTLFYLLSSTGLVKKTITNHHSSTRRRVSPPSRSVPTSFGFCLSGVILSGRMILFETESKWNKKRRGK